MILTFTGLYHELLYGTKTRTIRYNVDHYLRFIDKAHDRGEVPRFQNYWGSPRSNGLRMGEVQYVNHEIKRLDEFTRKDLYHDGLFMDLPDMKDLLWTMNRHKILRDYGSIEEGKDHEYIQIEWRNPWIRGPFNVLELVPIDLPRFNPRHICEDCIRRDQLSKAKVPCEFTYNEKANIMIGNRIGDGIVGCDWKQRGPRKQIESP